MEKEVFSRKEKCPRCGQNVTVLSVNDETVINEFSENYCLKKNRCGNYDEEERFAVLCRYSEFMRDSELYIEKAYQKTKEPITDLVHYKDIKHKGF